MLAQQLPEATVPGFSQGPCPGSLALSPLRYPCVPLVQAILDGQKPHPVLVQLCLTGGVCPFPAHVKIDGDISFLCPFKEDRAVREKTRYHPLPSAGTQSL